MSSCARLESRPLGHMTQLMPEHSDPRAKGIGRHLVHRGSRHALALRLLVGSWSTSGNLELLIWCNLVIFGNRGSMPDLKPEAVERYLQSVFGAPVTVKSMAILGRDRHSNDLKGYGYGVPLKVEFQIGGGKEDRTAVL